MNPLALLPSHRWIRALLVLVALFLLLNYLIIFQSAFSESVTHKLWSAKSFHPTPIPPTEVSRPGTKDYWLWKTETEFKFLPQGRPSAKNWNGTGIDGGLDGPGDGTEGCEGFPQHLLNKIQVVLKVGAADGKDRMEAQLSTVLRCIPNALIVSDLSHPYGPYRNATDVLASLPASTYLTPDDLEIYQRQKNASESGQQLSPGHPGWKIDKYKFLPSVEEAVNNNPKADWFVFLESDTYIFWDNMFRLLASYDANLPYYFGSPSPGRMKPDAVDNPNFPGTGDREKKTWFAYGGAGFVLSGPAAHRLVDRRTNTLGIKGPRVTDEYKEDVRKDCCGDSILGWALYDKAGVELSGLWPMFNPHSLHGLPFGESGGKRNWCAPVISLHKSHAGDFRKLWKFENARDRREGPLTYRLLLPLLFPPPQHIPTGTLLYENWFNADLSPFNEPSANHTANLSLESCRQYCFDHPKCYQFTWHAHHCWMSSAIKIGGWKDPDGDPNGEGKEEEDMKYTAGWDGAKIGRFWREEGCAGGEGAHWMRPSLERVF